MDETPENKKIRGFFPKVYKWMVKKIMGENKEKKSEVEVNREQEMTSKGDEQLKEKKEKNFGGESKIVKVVNKLIDLRVLEVNEEEPPKRVEQTNVFKYVNLMIKLEVINVNQEREKT